MTTPDELEQRQSPTGDTPAVAVPDLPLEADGADALEQAAAAGPGEHRTDREVPADVPEGDAVEQAQVVELDDDTDRDEGR